MRRRPDGARHRCRVCDVGNGVCRAEGAHKDFTTARPGGARSRPSATTSRSCRATAPTPATAWAARTIARRPDAPVNVTLQPLPYPTAKISVFVFEDDNPLNGENDTGGGVDVLAPNEPGLEGFNIVLFDQTGQFGDPAGQLTYDKFGQPVSNSLARHDRPGHRTRRLPDLQELRDGLVGMIVDLSEVRSRRRIAQATASCRPWPATPSSPTCTPACTRCIPRRVPTASRAARSGCRPTRWTAPRTSRRSSSPTSPATSRSSGRAAITSPSASPIRRSSMIARPGRVRGRPRAARPPSTAWSPTRA